MASRGGTAAPSSVAEGLNAIAQSITATMTAPDAAPYLQLLSGLQQAVVGAIHGGQKGPPSPAGGQGGPPGGGGMNLGQLQGEAPGGASAGPQGPPSMSGASADDIRRLTAQQAGMAQ